MLAASRFRSSPRIACGPDLSVWDRARSWADDGLPRERAASGAVDVFSNVPKPGRRSRQIASIRRLSRDQLIDADWSKSVW
jgi:hypothetical protein